MLIKLDNFLLDQVCQPIANWIHQETGISPPQIAEFFAIGSVVTEIAYLFFNNLTITESGQIVRIAIGFMVSVILAYVIVFPRYNSRVGMNPKRYTSLISRIAFLVMFLYNAIILGVLIKNLGIFPYGIAAIMNVISQFCITAGMYFASINLPPPREFRRESVNFAT